MIFLDSSFIISCKIEDDQNHQNSIKYLSEFIEKGEEIITSDYIFNEVVTVLLLKTKQLDAAIDLGNTLLSSMRLIKLNDSTFNLAWEIFKTQKNTRFSFTDCTILAMMKRENIEKLATFDTDFKKISWVEVIGN